MPATSSQKAEIRLMSGDNISGSEIVSDDIIDTWYDELGSVCGVAYRVARARLAEASKTIGSSGEGQTTNPKVDQIRQLLDWLRQDCPEARMPTGNFSVNLGIDEETDLVDIE